MAFVRVDCKIIILWCNKAYAIPECIATHLESVKYNYSQYLWWCLHVLCPQAVCCADGEHCCPQGYKCDVTHKTCVRPGLPSMPWFRKQLALSVTQQPDAGVPEHRHMCDAHTSCPRDDTCCFMSKLGKWGCCPLPQVRRANIKANTKTCCVWILPCILFWQ